METKHTPGPWHVNTNIRGAMYVEHEHGMICDMQLEQDILNTESIHADARLIAAAPELLSACNVAFRELFNLSDTARSYTYDQALATIQDAINKAEGRQ
jgi:hypothetical protein